MAFGHGGWPWEMSWMADQGDHMTIQGFIFWAELEGWVSGIWFKANLISLALLSSLLWSTYWNEENVQASNRRQSFHQILKSLPWKKNLRSTSLLKSEITTIVLYWHPSEARWSIQSHLTWKNKSRTAVAASCPSLAPLPHPSTAPLHFLGPTWPWMGHIREAASCHSQGRHLPDPAISYGAFPSPGVVLRENFLALSFSWLPLTLPSLKHMLSIKAKSGTTLH